MQLLHPQLSQAVKAEIEYARTLSAESLKQAPTELRKQGLSIFPCTVTDSRSGVSGDFYEIATSFVINNSYFRRGASVLVHTSDQSFKARIMELNAYSLTLFCKEDLDWNWKEENIRIDYLVDERTLECMELGLRFHSEIPHLRQIEADFSVSTEAVAFIHPSINETQQLAVGAILDQKITTVIQGPPGTGKTHTLALAVEELVKQGKKVVISAPSNTAVDHLCSKLIASHISLLRVGNNEKVADAILPYTIDSYLDSGKNAVFLQSLKKQLQKVEQIANRHIRNFTKEAADEKRQARKEMREIQKELRKFAADTEQQIIASSSVIAGTPVGLFNALSKNQRFDVVILDEAGQALAPLTWLLASFGEKLVLCGDPQQLPPVVLSEQAKTLGLGKSLLESVCEIQEPILLQKQYRMPSEVVALINPYFYANQLQNSDTIVEGKAQFIDMAGFGEGELIHEDSGSIENPDEADILKKLLEEEHFDPKQTVILAPYSAQIARIQKTVGSSWRVSTIDSIQGQEAAHIVISLTRSNPDGIIGFLKDYRRTNVAISRAQHSCYLLGDSATLGNDSFYSSLIQTLEQEGNYRSAWEFAG